MHFIASFRLPLAQIHTYIYAFYSLLGLPLAHITLLSQELLLLISYSYFFANSVPLHIISSQVTPYSLGYTHEHKWYNTLPFYLFPVLLLLYNYIKNTEIKY